MYFLYNLLLIPALILTSPFWIFKILTKEKYRKGFRERLGRLPLPLKRRQSDSGETRIHIHAVSVGEVIAVTPFIKELKKRHPGIRIILSTVTSTGNELAHQRLPEADHFIFFPFDLPWIVRRVIGMVSPHLYITVETELWPNFLRQVRLAGIKSIVINGRISPRTLKGYSMIRPFMQRVLANVDLFCMQSDEDARRIRTVGAPDDVVIVTGNMKYDQRFMDIGETDLMEKMRLFGIDRDDKVIIAGSTHRGEEDLIVKSYKRLRLSSSEKIRLIIVPRHPERAGEIEEIVRREGLDPLRRTALAQPNHSSAATHHSPVIIVDTIGELAALYSMVTVVIIGGSFIPHGGQNPLEAMYHKKPVIFGPHMFNFQEITEEILKRGAGIRVEKAGDLPASLRGLLGDTARQREMGEKGYQIIIENRGAVERNIAEVEKFLSV